MARYMIACGGLQSDRLAQKVNFIIKSRYVFKKYMNKLLSQGVIRCQK